MNRVTRLAACATAWLALSGCHRGPADAAGPVVPAEGPAAGDATSVALQADEIKKMGIRTTAVKAIRHTPQTTGYGLVMAHDLVATAVAELATAVAMEHQSQAAYARGKRLAGTPGALPADTQETSERQATVDRAALQLAQRRLLAAVGQHPPWRLRADSPELAALASGDLKLVRVTFPLGALREAMPSSLELAHIDAAAGARRWQSKSIWSAPADASVPGASFFASLRGTDAGEGERLLAWAPLGGAESGVEVPAEAAVISAGKYWCYIEAKPGVFVRTALDTGMPTGNGYFVREGVAAGDRLVTTAAGQLLAREMNPGTAAE